MSGLKVKTDPVDNVRRDAKDGAYHCPQCDTPFTRRSNLRRHFQIHTRNTIHKCDTCDEEFSSKQEMQAHTSTCYPWSPTTDRTLRPNDSSFVHDIFPDSAGALSLTSRPTNTMPYGQDYLSSSGLFPNFDSPDARYQGNYHALDMAMTPLSSGTIVPPGSPLSSFDGNPASQHTFSQRRPSTSSSLSSSSASSSPLSYTHSIGHPHATCYNGFIPNDSRQPNMGNWNGSAPLTPVTPVEEPVYTRQQVKDMIDVVSECLIDTMENVITRSQPSPGGPIHFQSASGQLVHSIRDADFRQTVISEAVPRVFYRIHSRGLNDQKL
ncbi:unnamed protein product [Cyclocybe aegerita]|uniref:C2H2-type domain-containing protein n=1 Tax=Cyclocybe aegerita TaxID=1973307 RepID=A0A8S0WES5_CYCAE|nr:unnamed protein product [Cyclocybe aegerita]